MKVEQFFLKMTTRGEISLRDIAHKITFFQSLASFHNLLVCSYLLPGKIKCIKVKTNDVTMYGRGSNL